MKAKRTAKQKAATKKLVAFNKARGKLNKKRAGSKKSTRKTKTKTSGKVRVTTSRKDFDMCKQIDNALKNKNVKEIIIKK